MHEPTTACAAQQRHTGSGFAAGITVVFDTVNPADFTVLQALGPRLRARASCEQ